LFPEWSWLLGFWIGAAIGSFLNVVIYRLPRGLSLAKPKHSFCPSCKHQLEVADLFPLLSWLILRGKCRHCKTKVSGRYFIVELVNATLWAAIWYQQFVIPLSEGEDPRGRVIRAVAYCLLAAALVAAIFTDLQFYIIPDQVNAFMLAVGIGFNIALAAIGDEKAFIWGIPSALAGALVGWGVLWGIALFGRLLFRKDAMGHGDIKMARGIGAVLFVSSALISFGLAVVLGAVLGIVQVLARRLSRQDEHVDEEEEGPMEPESISSLLKCGLGYLLCIDIIGLYWVSLYERWFGENPRAIEELEEEPEVELTMIPFGPYLAAGALAALLFNGPIMSGVNRYWLYMTGK